MLHLMNATFKDFKKQISLNQLRDICLQNFPFDCFTKGNSFNKL